MKRMLLGAVALLALGAMAPAVAADLPPTPYSKVPVAMMPAIYDWSGVYVGFNGGWGTASRCWDQIAVSGALTPEGCHNTSGGFCGWPGGLSLADWRVGMGL